AVFGHLVINNSGGSVLLASAISVAGNITLSSGTLDGATNSKNITVFGNWTNNGGTYSGGISTILLTAPTGTIGGTTSTTFPNLSIDIGSAITMNNDNSCSSLTLSAGGTATSFTHASSTTLTVTGAV